MFHFIEILIALSIIFLVVPQTPTDNIVLRKFIETGFFRNYSTAKNFVTKMTWFLIFLFLGFLFLLNL